MPDPDSRVPRDTPLHIHRNADFLNLWAAQAVSAIGSRITRTVLPIMAISLIDASPSEVAVLAALSYAPGVIVGLFAGGLVDRRPQRPLMIWADILRAVLLLTIPLAAATGALSMGQLYLVAALAGSATTVFQIADNTFLPSILPDEQLVDGNARLEASDAVAEGIGPWIGGMLVTLIGAPLALVVDAASYLWSALMLSRIGPAGTTADGPLPEPGAILQDARTGLRVSRADPVLRRMLWAGILLALSGGVFMALYMVVTVDLLALSPATVGAIIGVGGLGGVIGAVAAPRLSARFGVVRAMVLSIAFGAVFNLAMPASLLLPEAAILLLCSAQLFGDAFLTAAGILFLSYRQETVPREVLGRVNATFHVAEAGALVIGALASAVLVVGLPVGTVVWGAALGGLLAVPVMAGRGTR